MPPDFAGPPGSPDGPLRMWLVPALFYDGAECLIPAFF